MWCVVWIDCREPNVKVFNRHETSEENEEDAMSFRDTVINEYGFPPDKVWITLTHN